ncbi:hypothetical protein HDU93_006864, partial [Gonapodya sp. JEL0774]
TEITEQNVEEKLVELVEYGNKVKASPDTPPPAGVSKFAGEKFLFVCGHEKRDDRCGKTAPAIISAFRESATKQNLNVKTLACSHLGGHKYAGNVISYPSGIWLGRVAPYHADVVLREVVVGEKIIRGLWRGKLGWDKEGI